MKTAKLIKANGETQDVTPANGRDFSLDELQRLVGGYIEIHDTPDNSLIVINEEGRILGLKPNYLASTACPTYGVLVGDVLICDRSMIR